MQCRPYGATGLRVSALGFGTMRLPHHLSGSCDYERSVPILRRAIDMGVTYLDSAYDYIRGTSEAAVGMAIAGYRRADLVISTKIPIEGLDARGFRGRLETQLQRLATKYIDILHFHSVSWASFQRNGLGRNGCLAAARKAQAEGLLHHLAFSSHDSPENVLRLIDTGEFAGVLLQYNYLDRQMSDVFWAAHHRGMGTAVMGPVGGGRLALWRARRGGPAWPASVTSAADLALRWVLLNPHISVALSGMNTIAMVEENVASASRERPFTEEEAVAVTTLLGTLERLRDLYCTGCGYCLPCPQGVDIPGNLLLLNHARALGEREAAASAYRRMRAGEAGPCYEIALNGLVLAGKAASACVQCGICLAKCPQNLPIPGRLRQVEAMLG